jgi:hypothetical protein
MQGQKAWRHAACTEHNAAIEEAAVDGPLINPLDVCIPTLMAQVICGAGAPAEATCLSQLAFSYLSCADCSHPIEY